MPFGEFEVVLGKQARTLLLRLTGLEFDEDLFQIAIFETLSCPYQHGSLCPVDIDLEVCGLRQPELACQSVERESQYRLLMQRRTRAGGAIGPTGPLQGLGVFAGA